MSYVAHGRMLLLAACRFLLFFVVVVVLFVFGFFLFFFLLSLTRCIVSFMKKHLVQLVIFCVVAPWLFLY